MSAATSTASDIPVAMRAAANGDARPVRRLSRQVAADIVAIGDVASVALGGLLPAVAYALASGTTIDLILILQATVIAGFIAHLCLRVRSNYDTTRMDAFPQNPFELLLATVIALTAVVGIGLPLALNDTHVAVWYAAWLSASYALLLFNRLTARALIARLARQGRFDQRIAVFGAGTIARRVHDYLRLPGLGIHFVGVYDERICQDRLNQEGIAVAGRLDDLVAASREGRIDRIIVALPPSAADRTADVVTAFNMLPVSIHIVTHITSDLIGSATPLHVSMLGPVGLLDVKKKALIDWAPVTKRLEDIVLGGILLIASIPLCLLIALAIRLESSGPIFFVQRRRGRYQTVISVLKFRTMHVLEDGPGVVQAKSCDPRITRVGRILRRTSLDELPQLINVLKGEMSLVGPRPHALAHDDAFSRLLEIYPDRHQMRPGMTGLAQIKGLRGSTAAPGSIEARLEADLTYVRSWSLLLDLKILRQTIYAVVAGANAD